MYLKEKTIRLLRVKNIIFTMIGVFGVLVFGYYIVSEFTYYRNDLETAWHAKSMASSIVGSCICAILLLEAAISRSLIGKATFYSSYFEGDLDGYVKCSDLAKVLGKSEKKITTQLYLFRNLYMKKFELKDQDGRKVVALYSKKCLCECRNCGANIEKRIYFTGVCPYCGSSDLFAKVLADDRFYSISNNLKYGVKRPVFYTSKNLNARKAGVIILFALSAVIALVALMMTLSEIPHYFNEEYQREILFSPENHLYSYELIKADILEGIVFGITLFLIFTPLAFRGIRQSISANAAAIYAKFFSESKTAFIDAENLPDMGSISSGSSGKKKLKGARNAIRSNYLVNCTLEVHDDRLMVALAKKIVKDQCPSCGAPIVGAANENYVCQYCGRVIMEVIEKKF